MPRAVSRRVRVVMFDLFGTLTTAVSSGQRNQAHKQVAAALGVRFEAYLEVLLGSYFERASGRRGSIEQTMRWVASQAGARPTESQLAHACALRVAAERAHLRPRTDAADVLSTLNTSGVRTAVVSDCTHETPMVWPGVPLSRDVHAAVFSIEVGACKPDHRMYATACRRLGVAPEHCLYVGDGGSRELTGARRAGMYAVRLVATDSARHTAMLVEPAWGGPVINSLLDVLPIAGIAEPNKASLHTTQFRRGIPRQVRAAARPGAGSHHNPQPANIPTQPSVPAQTRSQRGVPAQTRPQPAAPALPAVTQGTATAAAPFPSTEGVVGQGKVWHDAGAWPPPRPIH
ncbi:MAG: HAD family hydrolase [Micromonosporaceae bacterium]